MEPGPFIWPTCCVAAKLVIINTVLARCLLALLKLRKSTHYGDKLTREWHDRPLYRIGQIAAKL